MNMKQFLYIITIFKEGNLTNAARVLGISQPTLSVFLTNLEISLGTDLFIREKKRLIPTPAGKIFIDAASRILQVEEQTKRSVYQLTHEPAETITVGASPLRGSLMAAQIFPQFNKRFPDVKVEVRESIVAESHELIRKGLVNFSFGACIDGEMPLFDVILISKEELLLGVPSFHRLAPLAAKSKQHFTSIDIRQFADSPFVLSSQGTTTRRICNNIFSNAGIRPTVVFESRNGAALANMIRQGAGAGILPRSSLIEDDKNIVYFSLSPKYYVSLGIILVRNKKLSLAERYLVYLAIRQDKSSPFYIPAMNEYARTIYNEFINEDNRL